MGTLQCTCMRRSSSSCMRFSAFKFWFAKRRWQAQKHVAATVTITLNKKNQTKEDIAGTTSYSIMKRTLSSVSE